MQVERYYHPQTMNFPVTAEIIQNDQGRWIGYIDGEPIGVFQKSHEALAAMRKIDARIANDLLGAHWQSIPIKHKGVDGGLT